ncbi:zinc ribbon domain-containing protein [Halalkalibacterium ligniniphilum]|uniref:zinc ribbon domain-containing protein n=1 Tax=Halalkalibacterium ligniniphilum TaxID=1134413 RepID=UPI00034B830A|nr:zinc ribbon domain-containing protein [Halalkalibacterium ligniniphilum]
MPFYTFECPQDGFYEEWHKSTATYNVQSFCPHCQQAGTRVFLPPNLILSPNAVRKRVEAGKEPKIVKKENLGGKPRHQHQHQKTQQRPWQISH